MAAARRLLFNAARRPRPRPRPRPPVLSLMHDPPQSVAGSHFPEDAAAAAAAAAAAPRPLFGSAFEVGNANKLEDNLMRVRRGVLRT